MYAYRYLNAMKNGMFKIKVWYAQCSPTNGFILKRRFVNVTIVAIIITFADADR